ncbi:hypothetical protein [Fodinibius sp. AD559]|uniref:hypothetical protein n=1 Tax=Fodinibius sp. AD559 TaxID=3424179 RepID=UPI004046D8E7
MQRKSSTVTENGDVFQNLYQPDEVKQLFQEAGFKETQLHTKTTNSEITFLAVGNR